jgi:hypothetical protein
MMIGVLTRLVGRRGGRLYARHGHARTAAVVHMHTHLYIRLALQLHALIPRLEPILIATTSTPIERATLTRHRIVVMDNLEVRTRFATFHFRQIATTYNDYGIIMCFTHRHPAD